MTRHLRAITPDFRPEGQHSIRVPLTDECLADLEAITRLVLAPADLAVAELRNAVINRDLDAALVACRRFIAVGACAKDQVAFVERHPA